MKQKCRPQAYRFMNMLPSTKLVGLSWNWLISKLASIIFRQNFHFLQKKIWIIYVRCRAVNKKYTLATKKNYLKSISARRLQDIFGEQWASFVQKTVQFQLPPEVPPKIKKAPWEPVLSWAQGDYHEYPHYLSMPRNWTEQDRILSNPIWIPADTLLILGWYPLY